MENDCVTANSMELEDWDRRIFALSMSIEAERYINEKEMLAIDDSLLKCLRMLSGKKCLPIRFIFGLRTLFVCLKDVAPYCGESRARVELLAEKYEICFWRVISGDFSPVVQYP